MFKCCGSMFVSPSFVKFLATRLDMLWFSVINICAPGINRVVSYDVEKKQCAYCSSRKNHCRVRMPRENKNHTRVNGSLRCQILNFTLQLRCLTFSFITETEIKKTIKMLRIYSGCSLLNI